MRGVVLLVLVGGCKSLLGITDPERRDGGESDGPAGDVVVDQLGGDAPSDGVQCLGVGLVAVCYTSPPTMAFHPTGPIDTGVDCDGVMSQGIGPELCVKLATSITIDMTITAVGARPLVLVATGTISIPSGGLLDVSSHKTPSRGAGSSPTCTSAVGTNGNNGAGGGGGGSFGTLGGAGGAGSTGNVNGGTSGFVINPTVVRGGCDGGRGGDAGVAGGAGGFGGGAVYLIAATSIDVAGAIAASGAGGRGGLPYAGGGGAGAGGLIGLDAMTITIGGTVVANGGGGGEGGGISAAGGDGNDVTTFTTAATGGNINVNGGDGGNGSYGSSGAMGQQGNTGGGGGGGGAGYVKTYGTLTNTGTVSPAPS